MHRHHAHHSPSPRRPLSCGQGRPTGFGGGRAPERHAGPPSNSRPSQGVGEGKENLVSEAHNKGLVSPAGPSGPTTMGWFRPQSRLVLTCAPLARPAKKVGSRQHTSVRSSTHPRQHPTPRADSGGTHTAEAGRQRRALPPRQGHHIKKQQTTQHALDPAVPAASPLKVLQTRTAAAAAAWLGRSGRYYSQGRTWGGGGSRARSCSTRQHGKVLHSTAPQPTPGVLL
jgi:hypothetical protein